MDGNFSTLWEPTKAIRRRFSAARGYAGNRRIPLGSTSAWLYAM